MTDKLCKCGKPRKLYTTGRVAAQCVDCISKAQRKLREHKKHPELKKQPLVQTTDEIVNYVKSLVVNKVVVEKQHKEKLSSDDY